ncbi:hypothetical protein O181_044639 [Austropuccinia psidii MF-1]|uniref:Uncharacterized protein n=1 Tax=Austropuccinia psidii MF-1 TaxID=1389203 RepID=A0A9Q3HJK8_9BASI|nr:hypothetical protein [Austropuccinia psidii MF-1]
MIFAKKQNLSRHNVYDTSMVMEGTDQYDGVEEGDLDVTKNLSQGVSDTNDKCSFTANAEETNGTRSKSHRRGHHSEDSDDNSKHENINVESHTQSHISSSKKNPKENNVKKL